VSLPVIFIPDIPFSFRLNTVQEHIKYALFGFRDIIVAVQPARIMICYAGLFVFPQAIQHKVHTVFPGKPRKSPDPSIVKHTAGAWEFAAFPASVNAFGLAALQVFTPFLILAALISASGAIIIPTAHSACKPAKRYTFLPIHILSPP
jgi:hypothetical protein